MMDRLTKWSSDTTHENGVCCTHFGGFDCCAVEGNCVAECPWEEAAWERLADYEDTGLTSAEVLSISGEWRAMISVLNSIGSYDRLRKLAEADKDGRLVVLPCKVGDTVYKTITIKDQAPVIMESQVKTLGQAADIAQLIGKRNKVINVFLTREEAEKALEAKRDG